MHNSSHDPFTSQASTLLAANGANGIDIEAVCRRYFQTFHRWLPFICEECFWSYFSCSTSGTDSTFSALLLSIYLIASDPVQDNISGEFIESVYSAAKQVWLPLQNTRRPSIVLIQASLLLATFENGQALEETSRLTMSACISMAYAMRLDVSIKRKAMLDLNARDDLNTRRCMWWAIVILERYERKCG
jgi:Fungal specific transcription factor domain